MTYEHLSVLLVEAVEGLNINPDGTYVDGTLGGGGHSLEIVKSLSLKGLLIGIDQDPESIFAAQKVLKPFGKRATLVNDNFRNIKQILNDLGINQINGILLDLGLSSFELQDSSRGFSFLGSNPLDMRMGAGSLTAAEILNTYTAQRLQSIFSQYGEERYSKTIAVSIVKERELRPFKTTDQLTGLIEAVYKGKPRPKIHPATKVYQALRIEVNNELGAIRDCLQDVMPFLAPGGRISIISFHSLEDRIVKDFFKDHSILEKKNKYGKSPSVKGELTIITKKPITPTDQEIRENPRSRSAKLRIAEKN